jgi:hypothetical protein
MQGENFSLYKNIKNLCKQIYQSIKFNDSYNLNICSDSFREINYALKDKILQKGGYNQNIEDLKNSIINKLTNLKRLKTLQGGTISEQNIKLKQDIIDKITKFEVKDIREDLKNIEKTLLQVLKFIEIYKTLQAELKDKQKIIDSKYNPKSSEISTALRGLMNGISPTELSVLQKQLKEFTENIQTIVNPPPTGTDDLVKSVKESCKTYLPNTNLSITPQPSTQLLPPPMPLTPPQSATLGMGPGNAPQGQREEPASEA